MATESKPELVLGDVNGQLEVYPTKVRIRRKGGLAKLTQGLFAGEKDVYFHQIGSVLVKRGGLMTNGYIAFAPLGGLERRRGIFDATHDENTVLFRRNQNDLVDQIRAYIEARMVPGSAAPAPDRVSQLARLAEMRREGLISEAEYEAEKARL